jgi:DNA-binding transcriptional MerR regulator
MPETSAPSEHLSIGEVLATLRDEYPDITISKIRFLESQGLIDPERTPSGYRKFYAPDIARLRWILHQQKEHFLPLKVIKGRLEEAGPDALPEDAVADPVAAADPEPEPEPDEPAKKPARSGGASRPAKSTARAAKTARPARRARKPVADAPVLPLDDGAAEELEPVPEGNLTRADLAAAAGLTDAQVGALEEYGLIEPDPSSGKRALFDDDALAVAQLAAGFAAHGIEARHLRMYRSFAEREATLYGQVIQGVLRQRNPEARARARDALVDLAGLGRGMRTAFLRRSVDDLLRE